VVSDISASLQRRTISVEVVLLSELEGALRYRTRRDRLEGDLHPDDLAFALAGLTVCTTGALLHSTSWRHERDTLVLTYVALPDPSPLPDSRMVIADAMVVSNSPLVPSPYSVGLDAVATHACRYLALLLTSDPVVIEAAADAPRLWALIRKISAGPAGAFGSLAR